MNAIYKEIRAEVREIIIKTNGKPLNKDTYPIRDKYYPIIGLDYVVLLQDALNYFSFAKSQEKFRKKYNYK